MRKSNLILMCITVVLIAVFAVLGWVYLQREAATEAELAELSSSAREAEAELEESQKMTLQVSDQWDLNEDEYDVVISADALQETALLTSAFRNTASVTWDISEYALDYDTGVYVLEFVVQAADSAAALDINTGSYAAEYYITAQPSAFYLPIDGDTLSITLSGDFQDIFISNAEIVEYDTAIVSGMRIGQYDLTEAAEYLLASGDQIDSTKALDVLTDDTYFYGLYRDTLRIYSQEDPDTVLASVSGMGDTRHMEFVNADLLVITARENGVFFVDISDPEDPEIISTYETLGLATGASAADPYVFICSRYHGVEIVDVSDPENPVLCSVIYTGNESVQCTYSAGYLYISDSGAKTVQIYDIRDVNSPVSAGSIATDGKPYGLTVSDGLLYIATGQHSAGSTSTKTSTGFGAGSGLEIYAVSDPENPVWQSTVKIDGRLYYSSDRWDVTVSGDYAILSASYSGVWIYDISDAASPVRVAHIENRLEAGTDGALSVENSDSSTIFPYDPEDYTVDCVFSVACGDGVLYLAGAETGLYAVDTDDAADLELTYTAPADSDAADLLTENDGSFADTLTIGSLSTYESELYTDYGAVYAVEADESGDLLALACGDGGVVILDAGGNVLETIETPGPAKDVLIYEDRLYIAEGGYGLECRSLEDYTLLAAFTCELERETISQLAISADGRTLLAQDGLQRVRIFDVSGDAITAVSEQTGTTMYFRNLIHQSDGRSILGYAGSGSFVLLDDDGETVLSLSNTINNERSGMCEYEGQIIAIYSNGYVVIDPDELTEDTVLSELDVISAGSSYKLRGKVACADGLMVVTDAYSRTVTILDISDLENPTVLEYFSVDSSPDVAEITDEAIYIPLQYQGLLVLAR